MDSVMDKLLDKIYKESEERLCKGCSKKLSGYNFNYYSSFKREGDKDLCTSCWMKSLKERDLTEEETTAFAQNYIERRKPFEHDLYAPVIGLPDFLNESQKEAIWQKVEEIQKKEREEEEKQIQGAYLAKAEELIGDTTDIVKIVALLLRKIEEGDNHTYNMTKERRFR